MELFCIDPGCIVETTKGKVLDMRDAGGNRLITEMPYGGLFVQYTNVRVQDK